MGARHRLALIVLLVGSGSCAAILGDDYVIDDNQGEGGSGNSGSGCGDNGDCPACSQCSCPDELAACNASADCVGFVNCVVACPTGDQTCLDGCSGAWPAGVDPALAFTNCGCAACSASCGC